MIAWGDGGHLVPIPGILEPEVFHLLGYLKWAERARPGMHESAKHPERPEFLDFTHATIHGEFLVSHAHVRFVGLDIGIGDWLELGCGHRFEEAIFVLACLNFCVIDGKDSLAKHREIHSGLGPLDELLEVGLADRPDRVYIG
jgi:hypothetical protein